LRAWAVAGTILLCLIVLPALAVTLASGWVRLAGQIILSVILAVIFAILAFFSYVCVRAQARKWGAALIIASVIVLFLIYTIWAGLPF